MNNSEIKLQKFMQQKFNLILSSKVGIYVPSTVNVNESVDNSNQVERVVAALSTMFGGATAAEAFGGWVAANGAVVKEKVTIVYSYCTTDQLCDNIAAVVELAEKIRDDMRQEAVSIEINGQLSFV